MTMRKLQSLTRCHLVLMPLLLLLLLPTKCHSLSYKLPPHSGYHGSGGNLSPNQSFFEGWYLRLTFPPPPPLTKTSQQKQQQQQQQQQRSRQPQQPSSLAFIFHVFDPHLPLSAKRGVGMQIASSPPLSSSSSSSRSLPELIVVSDEDVSRFRADSHNLDVMNEFGAREDGDYFHLTATRCRGRASLSGSTTNTGSDDNNPTIVEFDFGIRPEIGWGGEISRDTEGRDAAAARQYSTAGWLAAFPLFDPHYQVLMSKGVVPRGYLRSSCGAEYNLDDCVVYLEKNWGRSFPSKWFWMQCNVFPRMPSLTVTSTGAQRRMPYLSGDAETEVALIALHYKGKFLPFPYVKWNVQWGSWQVEGEYNEYSVKRSGTFDGSEGDGMLVLCPTNDGMKDNALETYEGKLRVRLYRWGKLIFDQLSDDACLEIGGLNYWKGSSSNWIGRSEVSEGPLGKIVMNKDLDQLGADALRTASFFVEIPGL